MNYHLVLCIKYICSFSYYMPAYVGCTKYIIKHTNKLFLDEEFGFDTLAGFT